MTVETKHLLGWLAMPAAAVANGTLRDTTCGKRMGRTSSRSPAVGPPVLLSVAVAPLLVWRCVRAAR